MPYQRNRTLNGIGEKSKVWLVAGISLAAVLVALIVFYAVNPRDFLQFFTTKPGYAKIVAGKNIKRLEKDAGPTLSYFDRNKEYEADGSVDWTMASSIRSGIGDNVTADQLQNYVNSLSFTGKARMQSGNLCGTLNVSDDAGPVMDTQMVAGNGRLDINHDQLSLGWTRRTVSSQDENSWDNILDSRARTVLNNEKVQKQVQKCFRKGFRVIQDTIPVEEQSNCDFIVADKYASGDRENIILSTDTADALIQNAFWEMKGSKKLLKACNEALPSGQKFKNQDTFTSYIYNLGSKILSALDTSHIDRVSFDLCVNRHNEITAANILVKRDTGDLVINSVLKDDHDRGPALKVRLAGKQVCFIDTQKKTDRNGKADITIGTTTSTTFRWENFSMIDGLPTGHFQVEGFIPQNLKALGTTSVDTTIQPADDGKGMVQRGTLSFGNFGTFALNIRYKETALTLMRIPNHVEITTPDQKTVQQAWLTYLFNEMPQLHPSWRSIVLKINSYLRQYQNIY